MPHALHGLDSDPHDGRCISHTLLPPLSSDVACRESGEPVVMEAAAAAEGGLSRRKESRSGQGKRGDMRDATSIYPYVSPYASDDAEPPAVAMLCALGAIAAKVGVDACC
jgi:hypothetical protein